MVEGVRGAELDLFACGHLPHYEASEGLISSLERLVAAATRA